MFRPFFLTRASIGLAASAVEHAVSLPGRAADAVTALPTVPVRLAGGLVQTYLHTGQTLTDLAVKGDRVISSVFPARSDQPGWATFDEDLAEDLAEDSDEDPAEAATRPASDRGDEGDQGDDPDVPTGRISPRRS